jgi:hypothetical protein
MVLLAIIVILTLNYKRIIAFIDYIKEQRAIKFNKRTNLNLNELYRLSAPPALFLFGMEEHLFPKPVLYFDANNLYCVTSNLPVIQHPLASITEVQRTAVMINKRRVWKIFVKNNDKQMVYKFRTYRNLDLFLEKVKENPNALIEDRYILGIFE